VTMTVYSIYILSKSGGLIYQLDNNAPLIEHEKTFSYPLELKLELINRNITVVFGQRDGIKDLCICAVYNTKYALFVIQA
ncbi:hypothetical protein Avbf_02800, partial [Armadillidium vulgare]